jgi:hypothetical protein
MKMSPKMFHFPLFSSENYNNDVGKSENVQQFTKISSGSGKNAAVGYVCHL